MNQLEVLNVKMHLKLQSTVKETSHAIIGNSDGSVGGGLPSVVRKGLSELGKLKPKPVGWEAASHANTLEKSLSDTKAGLFQQLKGGQCSWYAVNMGREVEEV